jgi:hypothetical protein
MKVFTLVLVSLVFVAAQNCVTPSFSSFCSEVVSSAPNRTIDSAINSYLPDIEKALSLVWSPVTTKITNIAARHGFSVCSDCITALKHGICSSLVPTCGFIECIASQASQLEQCPTTCAAECAANATQPALCYICEANCAAKIIFGGCGNYMLSRTMCADLLSICACTTDAADVDTVCQYFSATGYTIPYPSGLDCSTTNGWCASSGKSRKSTTQSSLGIIQVNDYLSLATPQSTGQNSVSDPIVTSSSDNASSNSGAFVVPFVALIAFAMML